MSYVEMNFKGTEKELLCIGIGYEEFMTDLMFTSKDLDYPQKHFHENMCDLLDDMTKTKIPLPFMFTAEIDGDMTVLGFPCCYNFIVLTKKSFQKAYREYDIDDEIMEKCLAPDTDIVVVYTGMNICG